jgi:hypothetical protein
MTTRIATAPHSAMDIVKMQLSTIMLSVEKAMPYTLDLSEMASRVLVHTLAIGAKVAMDIECPSECRLSIKDNIRAVQRILEPFTSLDEYTNETAGIICENVVTYVQKIYTQLA